MPKYLIILELEVDRSDGQKSPDRWDWPSLVDMSRDEVTVVAGWEVN